MKQIINSILLLITLSVLTGLIYPAIITAIAYICFPSQAKGSLVYDTNKKVVGSSLIGQQFSDTRNFWSRPSATRYNPIPSGGTNLSLLSGQLKDSVVNRRAAFRAANNLSYDASVAKEMLFASASGLDPHISPAAALIQVNRVANARNFSVSQRSTIQDLITKNSIGPQFGFLGESRVNVFLLNHALDSISASHSVSPLGIYKRGQGHSCFTVN